MVGNGLLTATSAASPFVIAIRLAQIKTLPGIINACLLLFTISFANSGTALLIFQSSIRALLTRDLQTFTSLREPCTA